ncbi:MAG: hypothetical protein NUW06_07930 [Candidatus Acetothermia bacterium]|jgi:hypothetical protein|nr:hypothetical protein [Candidatus Acetothermia bacterium]MDH7505990.1 hypothetical protein [Candidatus Acetothermia bacterium]
MEDLHQGGRRYWYEVSSRSGWKARYVKEVDAEERMFRFCQEIYNGKGQSLEIHEKYPVDKGHKKVRSKG